MDNNQNNYSQPYGSPEQNTYSQANYSQPNGGYSQPYGGYSQPNYSQANNAAPAEGIGGIRALAITSLITGILGLCFCWVVGIFLASSIVAVVTASIAQKRGAGARMGAARGIAIAGKITGVFGIVFNGIFLTILIASGNFLLYL